MKKIVIGLLLVFASVVSNAQMFNPVSTNGQLWETKEVANKTLSVSASDSVTFTVSPVILTGLWCCSCLPDTLSFTGFYVSSNSWSNVTTTVLSKVVGISGGGGSSSFYYSKTNDSVLVKVYYRYITPDGVVLQPLRANVAPTNSATPWHIGFNAGVTGINAYAFGIPMYTRFTTCEIKVVLKNVSSAEAKTCKVVLTNLKFTER